MYSKPNTKTINQLSKKSTDGVVSKGGSVAVRNPYAYAEDKPTKKKAPTKNARERIVTGDMVDGNEVVASEYVTYGVSNA